DLSTNTTDGSAGIEITNGAKLTLDGATVITSGTMDVASGGQLLISTGGATLTGVTVDDDGTGSVVGIGVAAQPALNGGSQIDGGGTGTLTIASTGQLIATGAALDGVIVTDLNSSTSAGAGIVVSTTLTLDDNTVIIGGGTGTLTIDSTGQLLIASGSLADADDGTTAGGATLSGVNVLDLNPTTSDGSAGIEVTSGATLTLDGATVITSGTMDVASGGQLLISTSGATLTGVTVDDDGIGTGSAAGINVAATLTLNGGTQIDGGGTGTLTIESGA